jgi:DNA-binding transcriptional ArsR family regulator
MHPLDALGSPIRREILHELRLGPLSVVQLAQRFPVTRPAVSRHLALLERAGLVEARASGTRNVYAVRPDGFGAAREFLDEFWESALGRLEELARP